MNRCVLTACTALAFTLLLGRITDRTTGQPLHGVHIELRQGQGTLEAVSDADGRFRLAGVQPGPHTVRYSSADVPPQSLRLTVRGARQALSITACSTTLDYSCAGGGGS